MSGINGIFSSKEINNINLRINKMNEAIAHRGPDYSASLIINNNVAFGHANLNTSNRNSTILQPLTDKKNRWTILLDGTIYNSRNLIKHNNSKTSNLSDAEIILDYLDRYGIKRLLNDLEGDYAICLYDKNQHRVYLIQDKIGVRPLYYMLDSEKLIFSSEIKGILSSGLIEPQFYEDAIDEYLGYRYTRAPYTFFKNIYKVKAGELIIIDKHFNLYRETYWELPYEFNYNKNYDEGKVLYEFKELLINSIKKRAISEVQVGTYLSGGVDSSIITAITSLLLNKPINTYTIGFDSLNEFKYAKMVADMYDSNQKVIKMDDSSYFSLMNIVTWYKDSPLGIPNEVPLAYMSRILKEDIRVVLSGEGADELLGGYGRIFRAPFDFRNHFSNKVSFYDYFISKYEYVPRNIRDRYLKVEKSIRHFFDNNIREEFDLFNNEENVFRFFHKYHLNGLLQRIDMATMSSGIEARFPFLDEDLIEYSYTDIPYDLKLKWNNECARNQAIKLKANHYSEKLDTPKYILKKIAYDFLPKEIINREKMGFPVPLGEWRQLIQEQTIKILKEAFWLKSDLIEELILQIQDKQRAEQILWMFVNVELFRQKYFEKTWKW